MPFHSAASTIGQFHNREFTALTNPRRITLIQNEVCSVSQITMTDRRTVTKYTIEDLWKFPCNKQSLFFFMALLYIAFQLNYVPHPKEDRCCLYEVILNVMDFNETYFNQTDLSFLICYSKLENEI